jgi:vitamin B12 transporter
MDFGNVEMDSYVLAALSAQYEIAIGWSIAARVDNLFNEQYEVADGYNTADRSVFVSMKFATK